MTYSYLFDAFTTGECGPGNRGAFTPGLSQWIVQSPDGMSWGDGSLTSYKSFAYDEATYLGWTSSIAFTAAGSPVVAYPFNLGEQYSFGYLYDNFSSTIQVATAWDQGFTTLTLDEVGLPSGTPWTVSVQGTAFSTSVTSLSVNVPVGAPFALFSDLVPWGYRTIKVPLVNSLPLYGGQNVFLLTRNTTFVMNFTTYYGVSFDVDPHNQPTFAVEFYNATLGLSYGSFWNVYGASYNVFGCPFPWYLPAGTRMLGSHVAFPYDTPGLSWTDYGTGPGVHYFNGTGPGSYTGTGGTVNLTVSSPFNETLWEQTFGFYSVAVQASGIPSTSAFRFEWDGSAFVSNGTGTVVVPKVPTGIHWVSNVTANGSASGWEFIGSAPSGGEVAVPDQPYVNLTFAYVDVAGPLGTVSFHALNLTPGTDWRFSFNGTEYSSSTPWINITTHSGTYAEAAFPAVSANGTSSFAVSALAPTVNVTVGGTYVVSFVPADELQVLSSAGGSVSPSTPTYWVTPGTVENLTAVPRPGYRFVGWSGLGPGSISGPNITAVVRVDGPIVESANFEPLVADRFNLTIMDGQSLPSGTWWSVMVDGKGYSSSEPTITVPDVYSCTFSGSLGSYSLRIGYAYDNSSALTRYVPGLYAPTACGGTTVIVTFAPQFFLTLLSTTGGSAVATLGGLQSAEGLWLGPNDGASILATAAVGYHFTGWDGTGSGSYNGTADPQTLALGGPVTEVATFAPTVVPPPTSYSLSFRPASPFPAGTSWTVAVGSTTYSSSSSTYLNLTLPGPENWTIHVFTDYSADRLSRFTPINPPTELLLNGNRTVALTFQTAFWVDVESIGPGTVSPASGWVAADGSITLVANATFPYIFEGWSGNGTGSYSGVQTPYPLLVTGPLREIATFVAAPPATGQAATFWQSPVLWAGLAAAALGIGATSGLLLARYRRRNFGESGGAP